MSGHPYFETAQIIEEILREQHLHDQRGDGVTLFRDEDAVAAARAEACELRRLGRLDQDLGGYPPPDL